MSINNNPMNDLQGMRNYALGAHLADVVAHFGMVPPLLQTQEEIRSYLGQSVTNSVSLEFNGTTVLYQANPYATWYLYPFLYLAMGHGYDDYRAAPHIPKGAFKNAKMMQMSQHFCDNLARELRSKPVDVVPPTIDVLVKWEGESLVSTLGTSVDPMVVNAAGNTWKVGHGSGDVVIQLPKEVEKEITPAVLPKWVTQDFTNPHFYKDDAYAFVQRGHVEMAQSIVAALPADTYLIVPGDGSGLFARLHKGPGVFGDRIVTANSDPRVVQENAEDTIKRANPGSLRPLVICSYVSLFFDCDVRGFPSLWIDTPYVMDRVPGLTPVTECLYSKGCDLIFPVLADRPFRRRPHQYHVPYLMNLLQLRSFRLSVLSQAASIALRSSPCSVWGLPQYSAYVRSSGSKFSPNSSPWLVPNVASMFDENGKSRGVSYFVPLGNFQTVEKITTWDGHSALISRRLYTIDAFLLHLIPNTCYVETHAGQIYFAVRDDTSKIKREVRVGGNFSSGHVLVKASEDDEYEPPDDMDGDYGEEELESEEELKFTPHITPYALQLKHVREVLMERPLGSRQLRLAIQEKWPNLVFSREELITVLKSDHRFRMGPNYWSVSCS